MQKKTVIVIPARINSTRFPEKVLAPLCGKPMIQWVYENAARSEADEVIIATDSEKVIIAAKEFNAHCVMTKSDHPSGTDRINEAVSGRNDIDIVINVQGDEPLIPHEVINKLIALMKNDQLVEMATVAVPKERSEIAADPNKVKVVVASNSKALYFSRAPIPFCRDNDNDNKMLLHWGIYGYRYQTLQKFVALPESVLEKCEKLEQLRALENGIGIDVIQSNLESIGVDTEKDLRNAEARLKSLGYA